MKKTFLFLAIFVLCASSLFAQFKHQVSVQTGIYNVQIERFASLEGAASYDHQNSFSLGLGYQCNFKSQFSIRIEFNWQNSLLTANNRSATGSLNRQNIEVETINIPILLSYHFNRFFFIDAGPVINFESRNHPENYLDPQNGIGFSVGAGFQYNFYGFSLFAKPNLQMLTLLPFKAENYHERLLSAGFVFGLGYNF